MSRAQPAVWSGSDGVAGAARLNRYLDRSVSRFLGPFLGTALALLVCGSFASAQDQSFSQMNDLLEKGYYNSAARLNGPDLVANHPDDPQAHFLYARALYYTGDIAGSRRELETAIELRGEEGPAFAHLGALLRAAEGDPAGALRALENAFLRTRDYHYAMDWGRVAWQAAAYGEAIEAFRAAAETDEGSRQLWPRLNMGRVLMLEGRLDEALAAFNDAIDVFERIDRGEAGPATPAYVEAYFRLGEVHEQLGDLEQAETNYRAARTADPNYTPAIAALDRLSRSFD